ncbi:hypothetical protein IAU60_003840 [Kwoniella sp. DSM 27419]
MLVNLIALLPLFAAASASVVPRDSTFGRLHPISDVNACLAASKAVAGAKVNLVACHKDGNAASALELWNITDSLPFDKKFLSLQSHPELCLDGKNANAGDSLTLQRCGTNDRGQQLSYSTSGYMSFPDANCVHKASSASVDVQTCWTFDDPLKFFAS